MTTLLRLVSDGFGPREFGLGSALPDAAEQILESAARTLTDRFTGAYDQLFSDHRPTLTALAAAGYQLPPELRAPAELALARRLDGDDGGAPVVRSTPRTTPTPWPWPGRLVPTA